MKDAWRMCTNSVSMTGSENIVMRHKLIFQFFRNHTESYTKWVRFMAGDIPWSENGCIPGSFAATGNLRQGNNTPWMGL